MAIEPLHGEGGRGESVWGSLNRTLGRGSDSCFCICTELAEEVYIFPSHFLTFMIYTTPSLLALILSVDSFPMVCVGSFPLHPYLAYGGSLFPVS